MEDMPHESGSSREELPVDAPEPRDKAEMAIPTGKIDVDAPETHSIAEEASDTEQKIPGPCDPSEEEDWAAYDEALAQLDAEVEEFMRDVEDQKFKIEDFDPKWGDEMGSPSKYQEFVDLWCDQPIPKNWFPESFKRQLEAEGHSVPRCMLRTFLLEW